MNDPAPEHGASVQPGRPFQFSLRTMLIAIAVCGVVFAVMRQVGPLWSVAIGWFLLLAAAHVMANAWASHSRPTRLGQSPPADAEAFPTTAACGGELAFAPPTRLRQSTRLGRTMFVLTAVGAVVGGAGGVILLAIVNWGRIGASGVIVGGISCSVLGALSGFLASTFLGVSLCALREATREPCRQINPTRSI